METKRVDTREIRSGALRTLTELPLKRVDEDLAGAVAHRATAVETELLEPERERRGDVDGDPSRILPVCSWHKPAASTRREVVLWLPSCRLRRRFRGSWFRRGSVLDDERRSR